MTTATCDWLELGKGLESEATATEGVWLLHGRKQGRFLEASWKGTEISGLRRWLALAHGHYFVQVPHWGTRLAAAPSRTVFLLGAMAEGFVVVLPLLDGDFQCEMSGDEKGLTIGAECGPRGRPTDSLTVAVAACGDDVYETIDRAMGVAVERMGCGKLRTEKQLPPWVDELGWCTYDAFYDDVDERRTLEGLQTFAEAGFHPQYIIIDGGWQHVGEKWVGLESFETKRNAFTDNRLAVVAKTAREQYGVKHVGAWHTLFGSMRGVNPESEAFAAFEPRAVREPHTDDDVFGTVSAATVDAFFKAYHSGLAADGVDFVKVDFQCALPLMTYDELGRCDAAKRWQEALQGSAAAHLPAGVLNCMSMSTDMVYHTHSSNVSRCSDDFYPKRDNAHPRHVRQNLYNALWLGRCVLPDWDMFWSGETHAMYHALARALSGGPVYVSDRPGDSDVELLNRFLAADGKVLRADQPAQPTADTLFHDPETAGTLIRGFTYTGDAGVLGLFHPQKIGEGVTIRETAAPAVVPGLGGERYAAWSATRGYLGCFERETGVPVALDPLHADLITFAPFVDGLAIVGLIDKYLPAAAVQSVQRDGDRVEIAVRGGGAFAIVSDRPIAGATLDDEPTQVTEHEGYITIDTADRDSARLSLALS